MCLAAREHLEDIGPRGETGVPSLAGSLPSALCAYRAASLLSCRMVSPARTYADERSVLVSTAAQGMWPAMAAAGFSEYSHPVGHFAGHAGSDGSDPFSRLSRHGFAHPTSPTSAPGLGLGCATSAPGLGLARATSPPGLTGEWLETAGENIDLGNIEASHIV